MEFVSITSLAVFFLLFVSCEGSKFELAYKDSKSVTLIESNPVKRSNLIECAAHCLKNNGCKGFSLDSLKTCSIIKQHIEDKECPSTDCLEKEGYSLYKLNQNDYQVYGE